MHIVIGVIVGTVLGLIAGSAALKYDLVAPAPIAVPANKSPAVAVPVNRLWDI